MEGTWRSAGTERGAGSRRGAGGSGRARLGGRHGPQLARNVRVEGPQGAIRVAERALVGWHAPVARDVFQQEFEGDLSAVHRVHGLPVRVLLPPVHAHVRGGAYGATAGQRSHVVRVAEPVAHRRAEGGRDLRVENRRSGEFGWASCARLRLPLGPSSAAWQPVLSAWRSHGPDTSSPGGRGGELWAPSNAGVCNRRRDRRRELAQRGHPERQKAGVLSSDSGLMGRRPRSA